MRGSELWVRVLTMPSALLGCGGVVGWGKASACAARREMRRRRFGDGILVGLEGMGEWLCLGCGSWVLDCGLEIGLGTWEELESE